MKILLKDDLGLFLWLTDNSESYLFLIIIFQNKSLLIFVFDALLDFC